MKFAEIAQEWMEVYYLNAEYKQKTSIELSIRCLNYFLGELEITEIKPRDIDKMIAHLAIENPNTGKPAAKKTIKEKIRVAARIFDYCIENDFLVKNPAAGRKPPANATVNYRRALTEGEQRLVLITPHRAQIAALIMMTVGLRRGEMIPLRWSDINWNNNTILVQRSVYSVSPTTLAVKEGTKNGNCRVSTVPAFLMNILRSAFVAADSEYITAQRDGSMHTLSSWTSMWRSYQKALNHAAAGDPNRSIFDPRGVPSVLPPITPHMLRHTCATLLWSAGVDVKTAAKQLGHTDIQVTLRIYTHLEERRQYLSLKQYDDYLNQHLLPLGWSS